MKKKTILTQKAPVPIGPYSQAISYGNLLFVSGQLPLNPSSGEIVPGGIKEQTYQVLENIRIIAESANTYLSQTVKTTVFLADLNEFSAMNEIYLHYFGENPPARSTIQVARLPKDAKVEIEAIIAFE